MEENPWTSTPSFAHVAAMYAPRAALSPPASRWLPWPGWTCSKQAATPPMPPSPPQPCSTSCSPPAPASAATASPSSGTPRASASARSTAPAAPPPPPPSPRCSAWAMPTCPPSRDTPSASPARSPAGATCSSAMGACRWRTCSSLPSGPRRTATPSAKSLPAAGPRRSRSYCAPPDWVSGDLDNGPAQPSGHELLIDGHAPNPGELMRIPTLGETLRGIAAEGKDYIYRGEFAHKLSRARAALRRLDHARRHGRAH